MTRGLRTIFTVAIFAVALFAAPPLRSHPHVLVDAITNIVFNDDGHITGIQHKWRFDLPFSVYAVEGLDLNGDGTYSREELDELAKINVESLTDFAFFTALHSGNDDPEYGAPTDYWLDRADDGQLTLNYTLPLAEPYDPADKIVEVEVYDPEYFVAIGFVENGPAKLINPPDACSLEFVRPPPLDESAALKLSELPPDVRELPSNYASLLSGVVNKLVITCGDAEVAAAAPSRSLTPAAVPFGVAPMDPAIRPGDGPFSDFLRWVSYHQSRFYQMISATVTAVRDNPFAAFSVLALCFAYGVLHAAGPGHGKAVVSSYVLATRETARRGALIAFLAALMQAIVAIAIISIMALILNMTSSSMTRASMWLEIASFALIAIIGVSLVWRAARSRPWRRTAHAHSHGDGHVHHADGSCCGHVHAPDAQKMSGPLSLKGAWQAILAVGIRPCSGALILLVFCFAQGLFLLGIGGTLVMALGTGAVTAAIAMSAVGARGLVERLASSPMATATVSFAIELVAGAFVLVFGLVFLAGSLMRQGLI